GGLRAELALYLRKVLISSCLTNLERGKCVFWICGKAMSDWVLNLQRSQQVSFYEDATSFFHSSIGNRPRFLNSSLSLWSTLGSTSCVSIICVKRRINTNINSILYLLFRREFFLV